MAEEIGTREIAIEPQMTTTPKTTPTMSAKLKKPLLNKLSKMDPGELRHLVADMQSKLDQVEDTNVDLRVQLANAVEERDILKKKADGADEAELKHIYDHLLYKDTRIMELNQMIMERERRIIDLQEAFSEQGQVARSKQLAVLLLGKRLQELDAPPRERKDVGTTTDDSGAAGGARAATGASRWATPTKRDGCSSRARSPQRNASPGRAIPQLLRAGGANGSPPPLDPTGEDGCSSYTTTDNLLLGAMDIGGGDLVPGRKKSAGGGRKKVTFFGTEDDFGTPMGPQQHQQQQLVEQQQQRRHHQHVDGMVRRIGTPPPLIDDKGSSPKNDSGGAGGVADVDELLAENDQLRRTISDMEKQQQQQQLTISNTTIVGDRLPLCCFSYFW